MRIIKVCLDTNLQYDLRWENATIFNPVFDLNVNLVYILLECYVKCCGYGSEHYQVYTGVMTMVEAFILNYIKRNHSEAELFGLKKGVQHRKL